MKSPVAEIVSMQVKVARLIRISNWEVFSSSELQLQSFLQNQPVSSIFQIQSGIIPYSSLVPSSIRNMFLSFQISNFAILHPKVMASRRARRPQHKAQRG